MSIVKLTVSTITEIVVVFSRAFKSVFVKVVDTLDDFLVTTTGKLLFQALCGSAVVASGGFFLTCVLYTEQMKQLLGSNSLGLLSLICFLIVVLYAVLDIKPSKYEVPACPEWDDHSLNR